MLSRHVARPLVTPTTLTELKHVIALTKRVPAIKTCVQTSLSSHLYNSPHEALSYWYEALSY